jgi:hypothetical protein
MTDLAADYRKKGFLTHLRKDAWWFESAYVLLGFTAFVIYSAWAGLQGQHYWWSGGIEHGFGGYLSPMYSPLLFIDPLREGAAPLHHAWLGEMPQFLLDHKLLALLASPAVFIVPFPLLFRFTCYYYRGAYYKAFGANPPGCAVGAFPKKDFKGETKIWLFHNSHRLWLYFAIAFVCILSYDAVMSWFRGGRFGVGVGTIILTLNPVFISLYTFGCHSFRHLIGGKHDCVGCTAGMSKARFGVYQKVSWLNRNHKLFAWLSLIWVGWSDVYVRLVSSGVITDLNTW